MGTPLNQLNFNNLFYYLTQIKRMSVLAFDLQQPPIHPQESILSKHIFWKNIILRSLDDLELHHHTVYLLEEYIATWSSSVILSEVAHHIEGQFGPGG